MQNKNADLIYEQNWRVNVWKLDKTELQAWKNFVYIIIATAMKVSQGKHVVVLER